MAEKEENKNVRVTVRFTPKEWEEVEVQMRMELVRCGRRKRYIEADSWKAQGLELPVHV